MAKHSYYDVLQVSPNATPGIIEAAYKALAEQYKNTLDTGAFLKIQRAYELLSDPAKRAGYDAALVEDSESRIDQAGILPPVDQSISSRLNSHSSCEEMAAKESRSLDLDPLYEAAIGDKNTPYYLEKFTQFDQQAPGFKASWNWPAFFLGCPWAIYRKMYGWFFVYLIIALLLNTIGKFQSAQSGIFLPMLFLALPIAFGVFANSLYHNNVKKKIAAAKLTMKDDAKVLAYFHHAGGVNIWVVWVMWIFGAIFVIGIVASIAIPYVHDNYSNTKPGPGALDQPATQSVNPWDNDPIEQPTKQGTGLFDDVLKPQPVEQPAAEGNHFDQSDAPAKKPDLFDKFGVDPKLVEATQRSERIKNLFAQSDYVGVQKEAQSGSFLVSEFNVVGVSAYQLKQFSYALAIFQDAERYFPKDAAIKSNIGDSYFSIGDTGKAIAKYKQALTIEPNNENIKSRLKQAKHQVAVERDQKIQNEKNVEQNQGTQTEEYVTPSRVVCETWHQCD